MDTQKRNTGRIIAIVVGALAVLCLCLVCVAGVAYWQRDQLGKILPPRLAGLLGLAPPVQAAQMMPADTPIYLGMSLNLQNQAGYENLKKIYLDNPDVQDALDELKADFTEETSLDFETDIQPWLGTEAALAIPDVTSLDDFDSSEALLAVSTRDGEASEALLEKFRTAQAEDGRPFEEGEYQGVTYWFQEAEFEFDSDTYVAIFEDFVVLASSEETLFGAIDRAKSGGESLADNERFQTLMDSLPSNGAFFAFFDWAALAGTALQEAPMELEPEQLSQLEAIQDMGMAATLQPNGMQINMAIQFDPEKLPEATQAALDRPASPNDILNRIPADAIGFYSSYDLRSVWQQMREGLAANPDFEQQLADLEQETGINLDEDIFSWMTDEFALVVTEAQPADEFAPSLGGYLLIGTGDVTLAQNKVANLADFFSQEMFIEFESQTIAGKEMQVVTDPATGSVMGGYGFWDNYFVAGYLEDALAATFAAPNDPVTNSPYFKAVSNRLPSKNYGYLYIDIDTVQRLVEGELSEFEVEDYEKDVRPFIEPLRAFGVAADIISGQDGMQTATMFLLITEE